MLTEDEAKTKWCPFARVGSPAVHDAAVMNRMVSEDSALVADLAPCVGSACMAWRPISVDALLKRQPEIPKDDPGVRNYVVRGYCGLAGPPSD